MIWALYRMRECMDNTLYMCCDVCVVLCRMCMCYDIHGVSYGMCHVVCASCCGVCGV